MIISCIGDSLTEGDYGVPGKVGIANVHKENYPYFLNKNTGWEVRNFGKCGYRASHALDDYKKGLFDVRNSNFILIMLGTNGGFSMTENTPDNDAYKELIALCRSDAPKAKIILLTPPRVTERKGGYKNALVAGEFVRTLAKEEELPVIEIAQTPEFTAENESIYQTNDGVHFVEAGYRVIAQYVENSLKAML
jgi:lysophospholipase L1-like esterase